MTKAAATGCRGAKSEERRAESKTRLGPLAARRESSRAVDWLVRRVMRSCTSRFQASTSRVAAQSVRGAGDAEADYESFAEGLQVFFHDDSGKFWAESGERRAEGGERRT
jgi:hypothetical protein